MHLYSIRFHCTSWLSLRNLPPDLSMRLHTLVYVRERVTKLSELVALS